MGDFRLLKDKILDKFDTLSHNWKNFTEKITKINRTLNQRVINFSKKFEDIKESFQSTDSVTAEILEDLETKKLMKGEISYQSIDDFTRILWESHDIAQQAFQETNNYEYHEMAMETMLVIKDMEQLKEYLGKHGKV